MLSVWKTSVLIAKMTFKMFKRRIKCCVNGLIKWQHRGWSGKRAVGKLFWPIEQKQPSYKYRNNLNMELKGSKLWVCEYGV